MNNEARVSRPDEQHICQKMVEEQLNLLNTLLGKYLSGEPSAVDLTEKCSQPLFKETFQLISQLLNKKYEGLVVKSEDSDEDREENIFDFTASHISDALFMLDTTESITYYNNRAKKCLGASEEDSIKGKKFCDIIHIKNKSSLRRLESVKEIFSEKKKGIVSFVFSSVDKRYEKYVTIDGGYIYKGKKEEGFVIILKEIEDTLSEEVWRAHKLESVARLAGGIGHSFNSILTGIITNLFMARMGIPKESDTSKLIGEAEKLAFKATRFTKQLQTFSFDGTTIKERISLPQLIKDSVGFCVSGTNVDYKLELPGDLPLVEVDRGQIDQVLTTLTINAIEAMPTGGVITISAKKVTISEGKVNSPIVTKSDNLPLSDGEYVRISITDEGVGIPKKNFDRVFDPYFSTKGGTGLGLTIAYSIVKRHGGHIEFESEEGKGSTFSFYLPLVPLQKIEEESEREETDILNSSSPPANILLMDDDVIIKTVVEKLLKKAGYNVKCVSDGEECLKAYIEALADKDPFQLVIMDLTIAGGGMGGKETVKKIKELDNNAKVIVFSGYSTDPVLANYKDYGFDGVLRKPFTTDELMNLIKKLT